MTSKVTNAMLLHQNECECDFCNGLVIRTQMDLISTQIKRELKKNKRRGNALNVTAVMLLILVPIVLGFVLM